MKAIHQVPRKRGVSPIIATILLVAITVVLAAVLYVLVSGYLGSTGSKPVTIGMASGRPTSATCSTLTAPAPTGTGAVVVYYESISITSTSSTVTTNMAGFKVIPTTGGVPATQGTITSGLACAANVWFMVLESATGSAVACYTSALAGAWAAPSSGVCGSTATTALSPAQPFQGGQTLIVYMHSNNPAGAYSLQVYGINGATVSGQADL